MTNKTKRAPKKMPEKESQMGKSTGGKAGVAKPWKAATVILGISLVLAMLFLPRGILQSTIAPPSGGSIEAGSNANFGLNGNASFYVSAIGILGYQVDLWRYNAIRDNDLADDNAWGAWCVANGYDVDANASYSGITIDLVSGRAGGINNTYLNVSLDGQSVKIPKGVVYIPISMYFEVSYENGTNLNTITFYVNSSITISSDTTTAIRYSNATYNVVNNGDSPSFIIKSATSATDYFDHNWVCTVTVNGVDREIDGTA